MLWCEDQTRWARPTHNPKFATQIPPALPKALASESLARASTSDVSTTRRPGSASGTVVDPKL
jgi:hypothetical protein